jgi:predicted kinase
MEEIKKKHKGKIILFIGLPASGKSTEAKERLSMDGNLMRVNRDDIRTMLFNRWQGRKEQVVTQGSGALVKAAVLEGYNIIVDDTNLNPNTRSKWKSLANELGVLLVEEKFETSVSECVARDFMRSGRAHVGRAIIENMALTYGLLPQLKPDDKVVIFDVDGTLADMGERKQFLDQKPKDYKSFYSTAAMAKDKPKWTIIKWAQACVEAGYVLLVVSGRPSDQASDATDAWLRNYVGDVGHLFMRNGGDFREDSIIKQEILDKILKWISKEQILFVVDDRPRVVRMWKENGITCYDVGEGIEF